MKTLPHLRDVIRAYGLSAQKQFGQNFLLDLNITRKIARAAGDLQNKIVLEVGPGPGGLTRALLEAEPAQCIVVEKDARFLPVLEEMQAISPILDVQMKDALVFDYGSIPSPYTIVANLPYNIATLLLLRWLRTPEYFRSLVLMFQKEVAERLLAMPGSSSYGRLSVMASWRMEITRIFDVPPQAFTPAPKVVSTVVKLTPTPPRGSYAVTFEDLEKVVASAFGQRRKMLRVSLRTLIKDPLPILTAAGINPTHRAEMLSVEDFVALTHAWRSTPLEDKKIRV